MIGAIDEAIYNNAPAPSELVKYQYRKHFGMTAEEMANEPADEFNLNLYIITQLAEKRRIRDRHGQ